MCDALASVFHVRTRPLAKTSYGAGTIFKRGEIWYVSFWVDGLQVQKSSEPRTRRGAVLLRDQLLGNKSRGEAADLVAAKVTCGELLNDLLEYTEANIKPTTARIWKLVSSRRSVRSLA